MWTQFMVKLTNLFAGVDNEEGQGMVEYSLILFLVSIAAIAILPLLGTSVSNVFTSINNALTPGS